MFLSRPEKETLKERVIVFFKKKQGKGGLFLEGRKLGGASLREQFDELIGPNSNLYDHPRGGTMFLLWARGQQIMGPSPQAEFAFAFEAYRVFQQEQKNRKNPDIFGEWRLHTTVLCGLIQTSVDLDRWDLALATADIVASVANDLEELLLKKPELQSQFKFGFTPNEMFPIEFLKDQPSEVRKLQRTK